MNAQRFTVPHTQVTTPDLHLTVRLLVESDLARIYHRDIRTIRRWVLAGMVPAHLKIGKSRFWRPESIIEHLKARETPSGRTAPKRTRRPATQSSTPATPE